MTKLLITLLLLASSQVMARWRPEFANLPSEVREWYRNAETMPNSTPRKTHGWVKCCDHADVVVAQFETQKFNGKYHEEWYYKTEGMSAFQRIPDDIIHFGEAAPYGLPTLFAYGGELVCFWPPSGAI
jgi:hypothetical protein